MIQYYNAWNILQDDDDQESVAMPNKDGKDFLCFLPKVEKVKTLKSVNQQNTSSMIVESEKRVKLKTPDELLEQLQQVHVEDDKVVQEFVLGVYDEEASASFNQNLSDVSTLKDPRSNDVSQSPMLCKHPLFLEERPVWHTINCNALPKDYKDTITKVEDTQISMIMDSEDQSNNYDSSE
ncbi:Ubiquitin-associated (UBA)/TS-N domain-containing protein [Hibiscus syriacus]|uniref:Ubiquitin-associated (UBA)/TS-N domain-containing protein n=1 Tax=Hibiscus syriacus TaxID=106335 RepID=A0A6A2Z6B3_HIBSY|nr:Ubiquitin-associated (UBA)/TS-N domain-containing protein [Hibiscus syriacus]